MINAVNEIFSRSAAEYSSTEDPGSVHIRRSQGFSPVSIFMMTANPGFIPPIDEVHAAGRFDAAAFEPQESVRGQGLDLWLDTFNPSITQAVRRRGTRC